MVHPKKVIIFSPSNCYKPVRLSVLYWTQMKIFWRMLVNKQLLVAIDFHSMEKILRSQWFVWLHTFFQKPSFVLKRRKKFIQFWNNMKVSKYFFCVNYLQLSLIDVLLMTGTLFVCLSVYSEMVSRCLDVSIWSSILQFSSSMRLRLISICSLKADKSCSCSKAISPWLYCCTSAKNSPYRETRSQA